MERRKRRLEERGGKNRKRKVEEGIEERRTEGGK
jgi:hypothetical protein